MTDPVVRASGIGKVFRTRSQEIVALQDASFDVGSREFVSFVGPSGCGKSTLLRIVAGLVPSTSGTLEVNSEPIRGPRADVGISFQSPVLLPWKKVVENVMLPSRLRGEGDGASRPRARDLLNLVGLGDFAEVYPWQLSGGMQQRVALARLLMTGATTLLLDEPFGALDEFTRERLNLELLRICHEVDVTSLFVTHNIQEAVFLSDRIMVMTPHPGTVVGIIDVPLARPRETATMRSAEFVDLVFRVRELLGMEVAAETSR